MSAYNRLYLTNKTTPYTPATLRGAWDIFSLAVIKALEADKVDGGAITSTAALETVSTQVNTLVYRGVSGQLAAQTISGTIQLTAGVLSANSAHDFVWHVHVYVTQGDSDTPRGTLLSDYSDPLIGREWPTTAQGWSLDAAQTLSSLAVNDGDRLVIEIGFRALNVLTGGRVGTVWYGTSNDEWAADITDTDPLVDFHPGWIEFSNAVDFEDKNQRVTQLGIETVNQGSEGIRISQLAAEAMNSSSQVIRLTQFAPEAMNSSSQAIRLSQLALEVMSEGEGEEPEWINVCVVTG